MSYRSEQEPFIYQASMESNTQSIWDELNEVLSKKGQELEIIGRRGCLDPAELDFIMRIKLIAENATKFGSAYVPDFLAGLPDLSPKPVGTYSFQRTDKKNISNQ